MVTVVDPNGTPSPIYNRSGVTLAQVGAGTIASPTQMVGVQSGHTIAVITPESPDSESGKVILPENCEVGDIVEFYRDAGSHDVFIAPPDGENFLISGDFPKMGVNNGGSLFRKVASSTWGYIISAPRG